MESIDVMCKKKIDRACLQDTKWIMVSWDFKGKVRNMRRIMDKILCINLALEKEIAHASILTR